MQQCFSLSHHVPFRSLWSWIWSVHCRAVHQLNSDLQTLDTQYNMLGDLAAKGERDDYNPE